MTINKLPITEQAKVYPDSYPRPEYDNSAYARAYREGFPWYHSQRFRIFITTTLLCTTLGLIFDFSRPAIYSSSTVLLTVTPDQVGAEIFDPSLQHALIQKNLLSAREILDTTLEALKIEGYREDQLPEDSAEFQQMLIISPLEETNLVEIRAEGKSTEILPALLNTLVSTYAQFRSDTIFRAVAETSRSLFEQQSSLQEKVARKRAELERFRANNNILALGRDENEVYAKLKGLTQALNTALENRVTAKAELDALHSAAAQGKILVVPGDERAFADLQKRHRELQEKLTELDNKYTRDYMALHPKMKSIPEQLSAVEKKIARKISTGKALVLSTASRHYDAAKNAELALQRQLGNYKQTALAFSSSFSTHEALKEELIQLEEHFREIQQHITELQVKQQQKYPQIDVIEPAYLTNKPVRPNYWRDAGFVLVGSVFIGMLAIWMYEFLRNRRPEDENYPPAPKYVAVVDPRLMTLEARSAPQPILSGEIGAEATASLEQTTDKLTSPTAIRTIRDLSETELKSLLAVANLPTRQLISLLLSGVRPDELEELTTLNFAPLENEIPDQQLTLSAPNARTLPIVGALQLLLHKTHGYPQWLDSSENLDAEYFNAMINCAAIDAGLNEPSNIDSTCLYQNYICFLVRSGIRLSELGKIVGSLSPIQLKQYGQLSPAGTGLLADEFITTHPALLALETELNPSKPT